MINKNFLASVALAGVLLFAPFGKAEVAAQDSDIEELDVFYAKASYSPGMLQAMTWKGAFDSTTTTDPFKPEHGFGVMGGSGAVGYYFGGVRVELDGSMYKFSPEKETKLKTASDNNSGKDATYSGTTLVGAMLSVNYDVALTDYVSPYFGVGCGVQRGSLAFKTGTSVAYHFASQVKAGVNVTGLSSVVPYLGYKFTYLNQREYSAAKADDKSASFTPQVSQMLHNLEFGIMMPMNA